MHFKRCKILYCFEPTKCKMYWLGIIGHSMSESLLLKVRLGRQWNGNGEIWASFSWMLGCFDSVYLPPPLTSEIKWNKLCLTMEPFHVPSTNERKDILTYFYRTEFSSVIYSYILLYLDWLLPASRTERKLYEWRDQAYYLHSSGYSHIKTVSCTGETLKTPKYQNLKGIFKIFSVTGI